MLLTRQPFQFFLLGLELLEKPVVLYGDLREVLLFWVLFPFLV
jgi:hypothetical protein